MPLWKFFHFQMWNFDKYPRGILVSWSLFLVLPTDRSSNSMPVVIVFLSCLLFAVSARAQSLTTIPEELDLGIIKVAQRAAGVVTLGNRTDDDLEIELSLQGESFATDVDTVYLQGGAGRRIEITFNGSVEGVREGRLRLTVKKLFTSEQYAVALRVEVVKPVLALSPSPQKGLDFGSATAGETVSRTIQLENSSTVPLTIDSLYLTNKTTGFRIARQPGTVLKPAEIVELALEFAPQKAGVYRTSLVLLSTEHTPARMEWELRGGGQAPVALYSPLPDVGLDFGTVLVGSREVRRATILNRGSANLTISQVSVVGGGFVPAWSPDSLRPVPPGGQLQLEVVFEPDLSGRVTGKLNLSTNDPASPLTVIPMKAQAQTSPAIIEILNVRRIDFGSAGLGKQQKENLLLWNRGGLPFTVQVNLEGTAAPEFTIESPSVLLQPGESTAIEIVFTPRELGERFADVIVKTESGLRRLPLQGEGRFLRLNPSTVDFGRIAVGESSSQVVEILNIGNVDFTVDEVKSTGDAFAAYTQVSESNKFVLPANGLRSLPLNLAFSPSNRGTVSEILKLKGFWEDGTETLEVLLNGTGVAAEIELHPSGPLEFGYVELGKREARTIVATNSGDYESRVEARSLTPEAHAEPGAFILRPGESTRVQVYFAPQVLGNRLGKILLISNDLKEKARPIPIRGKGALGNIDLAELVIVTATRKTSKDTLDVEWNRTPVIARDASKIDVGIVMTDSLRRSLVGRKMNIEWVKLDANYDPKGSAKRTELQLHESSHGTVFAEGLSLRLEEAAIKRARLKVSTSSYPGAAPQTVSQVLEAGGWKWEFEAKPLISFLTLRPARNYTDKNGNKVKGETERLIGLPGLAFAGWHNSENPSVSGVHLTAIGNVLEALSTDNSIAVSMGLAVSLYKDRFLFGFGWDVYDSRAKAKRRGTQDYIMTFKYSALF